MENEKSIQELLALSFLVPSYQRGYRWQKVNVQDLLNDLNEFLNNDKKTYSLQPLVVFQKDQVYHIVDGQQRLTTISILLGYLKLNQISIEYESRKDKQKNYYVKQCDNIDQYHVNQAYKTITEWFGDDEDKKKCFKLLLNGKLEKSVCFIWYCTKDDEVATFIRLNKGKISLTNAELIKALLLKIGNFDGDSILIQKSIAAAWNEIENTFNDDAFWGFIRPIDDKRQTRIDFLFDIIKNKNLLSYTPTGSTGNDHFATFRFFYLYFKMYGAAAFQRIWEKVNQLYNIFIHWYNEIEVYHYIGFLVTDNPNCIMGLLDEWMKPNMTIDAFKNHLKAEINNVIKQCGCNNLSKQYKYNDDRGTDKKECRPILLLFNIQRIIILNRNMNKRTNAQLFNKFPFYLYKQENWNVEHIASNTDNDLSKIESKKEWLKTFLLDSSISDADRTDIIDFVKADNLGDERFAAIRMNLENVQGESLKIEDTLNDEEKNQIWNFCLLDEHTNKSYGNSIFPVKRRILIGKEMGKKYELDEDLNETSVPNAIAFVPCCTKDAFLKAYTANATSPREWSKIDAKAYKQEMYNCLKDEFNVIL